MKVAVIGAGLAGSEAALVLGRAGVEVDLYEMRPETKSPAHSTSLPGELVCSNSFKSTELPTAHGLLKHELGKLKSPLLKLADQTKVPAGSALAVNREDFSNAILKELNEIDSINLITKEMSSPPSDADFTIIATGPLTTGDLAGWIQEKFDQDSLNFYDAIAPIIETDTVDTSIAFWAARWEKGTADYLNCPFTKEEYDTFYRAIVEADQVQKRDFEDANYFEGCLPIEVVAGRGYDALRYGMMRPVGLDDPRTGRWPFAVLQLRKENIAGTAVNLVGFQTRMTYTDQKKVFRLIPGLANAEFLKYGTIHRNSYINSPKLISPDLSFKEDETLFIAGQLSGNEGYTESVATGHLAALAVISKIKNEKPIEFPDNKTALGALVTHISTRPLTGSFSPSNINYSIIAPPEEGVRLRKKEKKEYYCKRALEGMDSWISQNQTVIF
jgi:methylenetetrahydrofolate--tRNA-(uracil-5-)-methyltransferase